MVRYTLKHMNNIFKGMVVDKNHYYAINELNLLIDYVINFEKNKLEDKLNKINHKLKNLNHDSKNSVANL